MKMKDGVIGLALVTALLMLAGCYSVPLVPKEGATVDKRLLGHWVRTHEFKHPEKKLDRIVMPPWAKFKIHPDNPRLYKVKSQNTVNKISYNDGYSGQFEGKTFLIFWLRKKQNGPPWIYQTWYAEFLSDNEVKIYSVRIPGVKGLKSVKAFQRFYKQVGAKAHFYEATYKKR